MSIPITAQANLATQTSSSSPGASAGGSFLSDVTNWLTNTAFGIYDRWKQSKTIDQNQKNWQSQFDYQKELNQTLMNREDNQYQRAVEDMRKAGLNPLSINGASTNVLSGSSGNSGNSAPAHAVNQNINPFSTYQKSIDTLARLNEDILNSRSSRDVASATAQNLRSQAQMRDVERQILEDKIPESKFKRSYFDTLTDEDISRLNDAQKRAALTGGDKAEADLESVKLANEHQSMTNKVLKNTMQTQVYKQQLEVVQLQNQIENIKHDIELKKVSADKGRSEIKQIAQNIREIQQNIVMNNTRARILGFELDYTEKTHDQLIKAINKQNELASEMDDVSSYNFKFGPVQFSPNRNFKPTR